MANARQVDAVGHRVTKAPTDYTGRLDERAKKDQANQVAEAAEQMSMATGARRPQPTGRNVTDYTDKARPKVSTDPVPPEEPAEPKTYRVRVVADIENMTFGKEIIDPGNFEDPNNPRMPVLGSLKTYNFQEGGQYIVDEPLYIHLRDLGYLYGE